MLSGLLRGSGQEYLSFEDPGLQRLIAVTVAVLGIRRS